MNYLDYAYDLNRLQSKYTSNSVREYITKLTAVLNEESTKEEMANSFMDLLFVISEIKYEEFNKGFDEGYENGYEDGKDDRECDCDCC